MPGPHAYTSVSTWSQPEPEPASAERTALVLDVARRIDGLGPGRLTVGIDGFTASGKTSFGHELASTLRRLGRPTLRASLDDFKNPWREAHLYDRKSGPGYYRNAFNFERIRGLLLGPMRPGGSGQVVLCAIDPITQEDHTAVTVKAADNAVLVVDGVFAFRPELGDLWDFRAWLDVDEATSLRRGTERDGDREGRAEAEALHRDRYLPAEHLYLAEANPLPSVDVIIDNRDIAQPTARWK